MRFYFDGVGRRCTSPFVNADALSERALSEGTERSLAGTAFTGEGGLTNIEQNPYKLSAA